VKFGAQSKKSLNSPNFKVLELLPASQKTIQYKTRLSARTIRYKLVQLKSAGLIIEVTDLKDARRKLYMRGDGRSAMRSPAERQSWVQLPVPALTMRPK
jgi:hypothetical protein